MLLHRSRLELGVWVGMVVPLSSVYRLSDVGSFLNASPWSPPVIAAPAITPCPGSRKEEEARQSVSQLSVAVEQLTLQLLLRLGGHSHVRERDPGRVLVGTS